MIEQFGKLIFIDLETTGPNPVTDRITEIGIVEVSGNGVQRWSALVNPQVPIPPFISGLTGITDDMVKDAPTFAMVQEELLRRLQGGLFIAHNARFDYGFLRNEFKRLGKLFRCEVLCTLKLSRKLFPEVISHGLDALVARHGLATDARHRALGDAEVLWQYWQLLERTVAVDTLREFTRQLLQRPNLPVHLDADQFDDLPDAPGVYVFYGEGGKALFIARAPHLRQRVLSHFHGERPSARDMALAKDARRFEWFETAGETGAQLLEARLMRQLQPPAAIGRPTEQEVCTWRVAGDGQGSRPALAFAAESGFARGAPCYGMFTSRQKAEMALGALAEKHGIDTAARVIDGKRLQMALASLPVVNWPYAGPAVVIERGEDGREDLHLVDGWHWLGTAHGMEEIPSLLAQGRDGASFEFDTYRILSRAIGQGKVEVRQLS